MSSLRAHRRAWWALAATLLLGACREEAGTPPRPAAAPEPARRAVAAQRPENLVLITLDTTRADALGAYGQLRHTSPNIDRLAREGVLFEQVATSNPETLPAHATIFTGKWPYVHGVRSNAGYVLSERHLTLAEALQRSGYRTAAEVAAPVLRRETQVTQGFEHYRGEESPGVQRKVVRYAKGAVRERAIGQRVGSDVTTRGVEFIRANRDHKFFLWLHYFDAHMPYSAPAEFNRKIKGAPYHAEVASADSQVGRVVLELERLGLQDRTLVVVTADHGEGLGEHGEPTHSFFIYQTTMHVPLVLWSPRSLPAGRRIAAPVRTVDIAPTVLDLLGLPALADVQGVSLRPLIRGDRADLELPAYGEATRFTSTFGIPPLRFLQRGRWKYVHKVNPELYDVQADPYELSNRAAEQPERVRALREELTSMLRDAPPAPDDAQAAVDAETAQQLIALGYVAKSPVFEIEDEVATLALTGGDPLEKLEDIQIISGVNGLLDRGEFTAALESMAGLLERNPESTFVMDLRATALSGTGAHAEAVALRRRIALLEPANSEAVYALAGALEQAGHLAEASEILQELSSGAPCEERFRLDQARVLRAAGRHAELLAALADGTSRCPELVSNANNYAWALATLPEDELRDGPRAVELMRSVLARSPDDSLETRVALLDTLGAAQAAAGDFEAAAETAERVLRELRAAGTPEAGLEEFQQHLDAYRAGTGIREP